MEISKIRNNQTPAFGMKFDRKTLTEVANFAKETKQLDKLDNALNRLLHITEGDVLAIHGKTSDGMIYSNFTMGTRSIQNSALGAKSSIEATFKGILELAELGKKCKSLVGKNFTENYKAEEIITRYSK